MISSIAPESISPQFDPRSIEILKSASVVYVMSNKSVPERLEIAKHTPRTHFSRFRSIWDRIGVKSTRGRLTKSCGIDFLSVRFQIEQISIPSRQKGWFGIDIIDIDREPTTHIGL
ncbi:hypothetical protein H4Q26_005098 [Puccinia striiformis f. sp. tritici PST-130]|nr:hypothetical protein H4Q26_005098 [Puccinia striiformis f. sp. tritici PST-130]